MDNFTIWQILGFVLLVLETAVMMALFKRPSLESQKALLVGVGVFFITIFFNLVGQPKVSEYFAISGFIIIFLALIRLFWAESKE